MAESIPGLLKHLQIRALVIMQPYNFGNFLKEHGFANQFYGLLFCACALSLFGFYNFGNTSPFRPYLCYIRLGIRMMDAGCDSNSTATSLEVGLSKTKDSICYLLPL